MFFRSISLNNFGPYKGEQRIELPAESGVSIIYGENMRGKTTLLNAIRYALFGKVITRGDHEIALHQIGNWEAAKEDGNYGFKVALEFEHDTFNYELTRICRPRPGVTPQNDRDYQQECFLKKDGVVLGPDQRDSELARIMPETVSRFFLFDGELLQQYEELLRNESDMGRKIKEAIERILGVPVLTNGRTDLGEALRDAQNREAKAAQRNQKTCTLGNQHEALLKTRDWHQSETDRLKADLEVLRSSKAAKEESLRKTERTKALLDDRARVQDEISSAEARLKEKADRRKDLLADTWKPLLASRLRAVRTDLENELQGLQERYQRAVVSAEITGSVRRALDAGTCSTCGQDLSESARERLKAALSQSSDESERLQLEGPIRTIQVRVAALRQVEVSGNINVLEELQNDIDELKIRRAHAEDRLGEIRDQTKDFDETEVRKLYSDYERMLTEIVLLQQGIKKQEEALQFDSEQISKVEAEMARFADADLDKARSRKDLCDRLKSLFASAVDAYRERLREKVEEDATRLFVKLTSEPEYKGLRINDNYGLTILHQDGTEIPVRSAGAEHIVALSLMGALQRNAPLRGPIVMDSPFGRLDNAHTAKVVEALPSIADQVLLLVYEAELERDQARNELKGKLRKEYQIVRRSARHSDIESIA